MFDDNRKTQPVSPFDPKPTSPDEVGPKSPDVDRPKRNDSILDRMKKVDPDKARKYRQRSGE